jgi:transposase-like protein
MEPRPRAGIDYPATWQQFLAWFPEEATCRSYLERLRWPKGFVCPKCSATGWRLTDGRWICGQCNRKTSVTAGTVFDKTRTPLTTWFAAVWYVTNQKNGVSALGLQRVLGLGSYQTAWTMLHKLRRAMVRPDRDRLSGVVEVDETFVGGEETGTRGRETNTKSVVAVAAEENGQGIGRIRLSRIADASADSLGPFVSEMIEPGSVVHTDGWGGYITVTKRGYDQPGDQRLAQREASPRDHAARPPSGLAAQALAARHSPGCGQSRAPGLLPRRVHLSLQPPQLNSAGLALLPAPGAGR